MYKKRILLIIILLLILTGCQKVSNETMDSIIDTILSSSQKVNTVSTSYEIYLPNNIRSVEDNQYNQILRIKDKYIYLYVDTTSYYYKNVLNFKEEENRYNYLFKKISNNTKEGYIGINKEKDDYYYCKIIYNYAKIEFYSDEEHLNLILANSLLMINSIKYNDQFIKTSLGDDNSSGKEVTYEFETPEGTKSSFSEYLQEFVDDDDEEPTIALPDEE